MAFNTCELEAADLNDLVASQVPQFTNESIRYNALNIPFLSLVDGGTVENNVGEEIKTLVTSRAVLNKSLAEPVFSDLADSCLLGFDESEQGQTQFTTKLQIMQGKGPNICVKQAIQKVKDTYRIQTENLKLGLKTLVSADIRAQVSRLSGLKAIAVIGGTPSNGTLNGGYNEVSAAYPALGLPTATINYKYLNGLGIKLRDEYSPELFGSGSDEHLVFSGSSEILSVIREQTGFKSDLQAVVEGGFADGRKAWEGYMFINYNVRGLKFAQDQQPRRFNAVDGNNYPIWIEPLVAQSVDFGREARVNPTWVNALYEEGILWSKNAFRRLVPKSYTGEPGSEMKYPAQMYGTELAWHNVIDNSCNPWGDIGWHKWRMARAFQARRPHGVISILYKRCPGDYGLEACTGVSTDIVV